MEKPRKKKNVTLFLTGFFNNRQTGFQATEFLPILAFTSGRDCQLYLLDNLLLYQELELQCTLILQLTYCLRLQSATCKNLLTLIQCISYQFGLLPAACYFFSSLTRLSDFVFEVYFHYCLNRSSSNLACQDVSLFQLEQLVFLIKFVNIFYILTIF